MSSWRQCCVPDQKVVVHHLPGVVTAADAHARVHRTDGTASQDAGYNRHQRTICTASDLNIKVTRRTTLTKKATEPSTHRPIPHKTPGPSFHLDHSEHVLRLSHLTIPPPLLGTRRDALAFTANSVLPSP